MTLPHSHPPLCPTAAKSTPMHTAQRNKGVRRHKRHGASSLLVWDLQKEIGKYLELERGIYTATTGTQHVCGYKREDTRLDGRTVEEDAQHDAFQIEHENPPWKHTPILTAIRASWFLHLTPENPILRNAASWQNVPDLPQNTKWSARAGEINTRTPQREKKIKMQSTRNRRNPSDI